MKFILVMIFLCITVDISAAAMPVNGLRSHVKRMQAARAKKEKEKGRFAVTKPEDEVERLLREKLALLSHERIDAEAAYADKVRRAASRNDDKCVGCPKGYQVRSRYLSQGVETTQRLLTILERRLTRWTAIWTLKQANGAEGAVPLKTKINVLEDDIADIRTQKNEYEEKQLRILRRHGPK